MSNVTSNIAASSNSSSQGQKYFDLHTTGVGYLSRVREVQVRKADPFLAVDVSALRGSGDEVEYTRFDCRVSGAEAQKLIRLLKPHVDARKKVLIGFKIGDLYPELFTYTQGERAGQTGISLKAHLLRISFAKVDGNLIFQARDSADHASNHPEAQGSAPMVANR